jgi:hypothetical protein
MAPAAAQQPGPKLEMGIGWSALHLDDIEFTARTNAIITEIIDHESDHDGEMNGYKLTGELSGLMPSQRGDWLMTVALRGFYSRYEDEQDSRCLFTADSDCAFIPLIDPDPATISLGQTTGGLGSDWRTNVEREAVYWGAALELDFDRYSAPAVSLKDSAPLPAPSLFHWRAGLSVRRLDQDTSLRSEDVGLLADPVLLTEDLNTNYFGGYFGFITWKPLDHGLRLKLGGETGLYYADTDYQGSYSSSASLAGPPVGPQSLSLSDSAPAFIGLLNLALERDFGNVTFSIFGEAEWISYVPKVLYNDTDLNGGVPFDIVGVQDGTELGDGSAISYTVGARVRMPLQ